MNTTTSAIPPTNVVADHDAIAKAIASCVVHVCGGRIQLPIPPPVLVAVAAERGIQVALYQLQVSYTARPGRDLDIVAQLARLPGVQQCHPRDDGSGALVSYRAVAP